MLLYMFDDKLEEQRRRGGGGARGGRGAVWVTSKNGVIRVGFNGTARSVVRHFLTGF